jgi:ERCC4-type nuclease
VVIQGDEHSRAKALAMSKHYHQVTYFGYLGAIASLNRYTTVIESYSPHIQEAYYRMLITAKKCLSTKPIIKKFPRKHKNPAMNFLCHDIYGINYKKAELIVKEYNLQSLNDLMKLTHEDLTKIDGIADKTAEKIIGAIHG